MELPIRFGSKDPYKKLMNADITNQVNRMLVIEIMPKDHNDPNIAIPQNGEKIEVYGARITDLLMTGIKFHLFRRLLY